MQNEKKKEVKLEIPLEKLDLFIKEKIELKIAELKVVKKHIVSLETKKARKNG